MRTIVINTSKEAENTKLNILFKAPFDQSSVLWFYRGLPEIGELACEIKQAVITDADVIDRDYNLIVLVDLYSFPRGNEKDANRIYKALLTNYIRVNLVTKLYDEFNLMPMEVSVYFTDSAKLETVVSTPAFRNPLEQKIAEEQAALDSERPRLRRDEDGNLIDSSEIKLFENKVRSVEELLIMSIFSWTEKMDSESFVWTLKISITEDEYLDFYKVFFNTAESIKNSDKTADVLSIALNGVQNILSNSEQKGDWRSNYTVRYPISIGGEIDFNCISCSFLRDNEQSLTEGYFSVFANIYTCVKNGRLSREYKSYGKDEIKHMLKNALERFEYFSNEDNISLTFESVAEVFMCREAIYKKRGEIAKEANGNSKKNKDEIIAEIKNVSVVPKDYTDGNVPSGARMHGVDGEFYSLVSDIFRNYDEEVIRAQNHQIVEVCLKDLWKWRDKQTNEDFIDTLKQTIKMSGEYKKDKTPEDSKADIAFIREEYDRESTELLNAVTEAEHNLASNQNILFETKELILQYGDLMRKGKIYLISLIGGFIAVLASIFPYLYVQTYSSDSNIIHRILFFIFTAGFVALYCAASLIYSSKISRKKRELCNELKELKDKSEEERERSIRALYEFYSETIIKTESHYLLWREILRRDRENSKKHMMRNNHRKHLKQLVESVRSFATKMKLELDNKSDDQGGNFETHLELKGEESFFSPNNRNVYSILPDEYAVSEDDEEGGKEQ